MYYMFLGTMQIPIPPETMRTRIKNRNKTISLVNRGEINILKTTGLTEITFKMLLPNANYPFNQSIIGKSYHAAYYIDQLEQLKLSSDPFQFIIVRMTDGGELLNMTNLKCTLEDYSLDEDAREGYDFYANVVLKEYREWGAKKIDIKTNANGEKVGTTEATRSTTGKASTPDTVTAKSGDTLQSICKKYLGPMALNAAMGLPFIKKLNKIAIPAVLTAGQVIKMKNPNYQVSTKMYLKGTSGGFINNGNGNSTNTK